MYSNSSRSPPMYKETHRRYFCNKSYNDSSFRKFSWSIARSKNRGGGEREFSFISHETNDPLERSINLPLSQYATLFTSLITDKLFRPLCDSYERELIEFALVDLSSAQREFGNSRERDFGYVNGHDRWPIARNRRQFFMISVFNMSTE